MVQALRLARITGWALVVTAAMLAMVADVHLARYRAHTSDTLPVWGSVPGFRLITQDGRALALDDLRGKVWVANFFFTSCAGICPIMQANMQKVQEAFARNPRVQLVSVTVDPERDTVQVLDRYARQRGAPSDQWHFLTGEKSLIYHLAREGCKLAAMEASAPQQGGSRDFIHSEKCVLVDTHGRIRGYYRGTDSAEVTRLIGDIRRLLHEKEP
jgi:protein SCO1/2